MNNSLYMRNLPIEYRFCVKDPMSALTHFIGFWVALIGMPVLLIRAAYLGCDLVSMISMSIFMVSMIILYGASTSYHTFHISEKADKVLKKIDHMMIFVLIAGTYTPVCLIVLKSTLGIRMLVVVWAIALAGIMFKAFWVTCPKWLSSVMYIGMGWVAVFAFPAIYASLSKGAFTWLLTGGILYTIGGVIYALKIKCLDNLIKGFGRHEIFHVFVMLGSFCHYMMVYLYLTQM